MKKLTQHLLISLVAVGLSWPALAATLRAIKIGVLNDACGGSSLVETSKNN
jgi:hypothetical protein